MPKIFGIEHILFVLIYTVITVASLICVKKYAKTQKVKNIIIKSVAGLLLACILFNRIAIAVVAKDWLDLIPGSVCGVTSFLFSLTVLFSKRENNLFHFFIYIAFIGCLLTVIYPDFIGQASSIWYSKTISGLLHHAVSLYLVLLLFVTGFFKPDIKKWWCLWFGLCAYITYGIFGMQVFEWGNAMGIAKPLIEGSSFHWYFAGLIMVSLHMAFLLGFEYLYKRRIKKEVEN